MSQGALVDVNLPPSVLAPVTTRIVAAVLSGVVLLLQITATRLLSATVSYHAAFVILALVMLALAASASAVYRDRMRGDQSGTVVPAIVAVRGGIAIAGCALGYVAAGAIPWPATVEYGVHLAVAGIGLYVTFHACGYVTAWLMAAWPRDIGACTSRIYVALPSDARSSRQSSPLQPQCRCSWSARWSRARRVCSSATQNRASSGDPGLSWVSSAFWRRSPSWPRPGFVCALRSSRTSRT